MKAIASLVVGLCCSVSFAADNHKVRRGLDEIQAATSQTREILAATSSSVQKRRLRNVLDRLATAEEVLTSSLGGASGGGNSDGGGGGHGHHPYPPRHHDNGSLVELYYSDSCSGNLIGMAGPETDCRKFAGAGPVWGVKVNGVCTNTTDMPAINACEAFKGIASRNGVKFYNSDSCNGNLSGVFTPYSDCESMNSTNGNVWGVEINGQCQNISDTTPAHACRAFKAAQTSYAIKIYHSDSCSGSLLAYVDSRTKCEGLRGMGDAWGIMINGKCENIADTDIVSACQRFKP